MQGASTEKGSAEVVESIGSPRYFPVRDMRKLLADITNEKKWQENDYYNVFTVICSV
jgi:hypothetical protein